jgi:hypothetical protein
MIRLRTSILYLSRLNTIPPYVLRIRIGFSAHPDPDPVFISVRMRIQGAKPMRIRIRTRKTLDTHVSHVSKKYLPSNPAKYLL